MIRHRKIIGGGIASAATIAAALLVVPALATPNYGGFSPSTKFFGTFAPFDYKAEKDGKWDLLLRSKGLTDVRVTEVSFPPNSSSGWHSHPGPNLLIAIEGEVVEYEGDDALCVGHARTATAVTGTTPKTGETFGDAGGSHVHLVRNESSTVAAKVLAIAFYPNGSSAPLTDSTRPRPNNCPSTVL